jgi:hypothetical protein
VQKKRQKINRKRHASQKALFWIGSNLFCHFIQSLLNKCWSMFAYVALSNTGLRQCLGVLLVPDLGKILFFLWKPSGTGFPHYRDSVTRWIFFLRSQHFYQYFLCMRWWFQGLSKAFHYRYPIQLPTFY